MARLYFQRLESIEDLTLFKNEAAEYINVVLPQEYLSKGKVVAIVSKDGEQTTMHGGFVISDSFFRSVSQIPGKDKKIVSEKFNRKLDHSFEVNGLWINSRTTSGVLVAMLWALLAYEMFKMVFRGKYYFVYSYEQSKNHLANLYSQFKPTCLYAGPVNMLEGMSEPAVEVVECCSLKNLMLAMIKKPHFFIKRILRKKTKAAYVITY